MLRNISYCDARAARIHVRQLLNVSLIRNLHPSPLPIMRQVQMEAKHILSQNSMPKILHNVNRWHSLLLQELPQQDKMRLQISLILFLQQHWLNLRYRRALPTTHRSLRCVLKMFRQTKSGQVMHPHHVNVTFGYCSGLKITTGPLLSQISSAGR